MQHCETELCNRLHESCSGLACHVAGSHDNKAELLNDVVLKVADSGLRDLV